jgi:hypothetical protein
MTAFKFLPVGLFLLVWDVGALSSALPWSGWPANLVALGLHALVLGGGWTWAMRRRAGHDVEGVPIGEALTTLVMVLLGELLVLFGVPDRLDWAQIGLFALGVGFLGFGAWDLSRWSAGQSAN